MLLWSGRHWPDMTELTVKCIKSYLIFNLDKQEKDHEDKQVVKDTDSPDDDVDDLENRMTLRNKSMTLRTESRMVTR